MNRWLKLRLRGRLLLSFLLVIGMSIGLVIGYATLTPFNEIDDVGNFFSQQYGVRFAPFFAASYQADPSWGEAEQLMTLLIDNRSDDGLLPGSLGPLEVVESGQAFHIERLIVLDLTGEVVADVRTENSPAQPLAELRPLAVPLTDPTGQAIGELIVVSGFNATFADRLQLGFRRIVITIGVWAALVALGVSLVLSQRLSQPLRRLSQAAIDLADEKDFKIVPTNRKDEIGEMTEAFNQMAGRIQEQRRLRKQMVADIAHELRTPLSIMRLDLAGMVDELQTPEAAAESLEQEIEALEKLITDLNLLSLADWQELELKLVPLEPVSFLMQALDQWEPLARDRRVDLCFERPDHPLPTIEADERRLFQIMHNLVSNALRYTPEGSRLTFALAVQPAQQLLGGTVPLPMDCVIFSVEDEGEGIRPEEIEFLFDRFYRASGGRVSERSGSGLGLAIAKQLVEMHQGAIWCESEPGQGCRFFVALPV